MSSIYISEPATDGKVCLKTTVGDIEIELWSKECPLAVRNFVQLCMEGYYDRTVFHRVIKDFIVQGGDPTGTGDGGHSIYDKSFKNELHQRLKFNHRGLVGMATSEDGLNGSQFFFTLGPTPSLDKKHTIFGKVVGNTIFNMLRLNECETDESDRPVTVQKILSADILSNPFPDIIPREKKAKKKKETKVVKDEKKNLGLLSFGDEAEEDEIELQAINQKLKGKSAHDVLSDEMLSKEPAVSIDELQRPAVSTTDVDIESEERIQRIRKKLEMRKRRAEDQIGETEEDGEMDFEKIMKQELSDREKKELEDIAAQVKTAKKDLKALMRPKKDSKDSDEEEPVSNVIRQHREMRQLYKTSAAKFKQNDAEYQRKSALLIEKLMAKTGEVESTTSAPEAISNPTVEQSASKLNLDNEEDLSATELISHTFVAPEDSSEVSKAKDANLREESEDWYDLNDPRNKMNQRRRGL